MGMSLGQPKLDNNPEEQQLELTKYGNVDCSLTSHRVQHITGQQSALI